MGGAEDYDEVNTRVLLRRGHRMIVAMPQTAPVEQRFRLSCVSWPEYLAISDGLGERPIRCTYDRGELEIMTVSFKHENRKSRLNLFVHVIVEELEIEILSAGNMTCRNESMERALEPEECYWIAHADQLAGRDEIDLDIDPPPDLALEIEISRSALDRIGIYAALKVPEVWRWDGAALSVQHLTARGAYRDGKKSKVFPFLLMDEFAAFLHRDDLSETKLIRAFRDWVREHRDEWRS